MGAHAFTGSLAPSGTFTAAVGTVDPVTSSPTQVDPVIGVLESHARLSVHVPPPPKPPVLRRVGLGLVLTMPTPAIVAGRPVIPKLLGVVEVSGTATAGAGHLRGFADPDPVWSGSAWTTPPPDAPAGSSMIRWTARDLPNPASHGGKYLLGTRSTLDATSGLPSGVEQWSAAGGSDFAIPWASSYPFKPTVQNHVHYGEDGNVYTETAGVHFDLHRCAHMWADFGTVLTPPFTVIAVAVMLNFPSRGYLNYVFDAGFDPGTALTASQRSSIWSKGVTGDIKLSEAEGYRNGLRIGHTQMQGFNDVDPSTRLARVPFIHTLKPKMLAMVVDGANSSFSMWENRTYRSKGVRLANHGAQRLWVMGRANGILSSRFASSMVVFEIRAWDRALGTTHLYKQYQQLSSTWKFSLYDRQIRNNARALD